MNFPLFYFIFLIVFCFTQNGYAQYIRYPDISDSNQVLFIGEHHYIEENYALQLEMIQHYVNNESYNTIILEKSASLQVIIDNMIKNKDTTGIHFTNPVVLCNTENCHHNFKPMIDFIIRLTDFAREKNIPVYCLDVELYFVKTKQILVSILDTSYTVNPKRESLFENLMKADANLTIFEELLVLYNTKSKWKKDISEPAYTYIENILTTVYKQSQDGRFMWSFREQYLYDQFNALLKENKQLKPIAINGLLHTHKHWDSELNLSESMRYSVATYLNNDEKSACKGKVTSIALTYFFNSDEDSTFTYFGYFENEDLRLLKDSLANHKYFISRTSDISISPYLKKAFDYVIAINDCNKLFQHTKYYRNCIAIRKVNK